jgi:hypothetical protein
MRRIGIFFFSLCYKLLTSRLSPMMLELSSVASPRLHCDRQHGLLDVLWWTASERKNERVVSRMYLIRCVELWKIVIASRYSLI